MGGEGEGEEGGEGGGVWRNERKNKQGELRTKSEYASFFPSSYSPPLPSRPFENEPLDDRDFSPAI